MLHDEMEKVVRAAKAWSRANDTNQEAREKRLRNAVERYLTAEKKAKQRQLDKEFHDQAAKEKTWVDADGKRTLYAELDGKHLYNIRRGIQIDSPHHDGIWYEIKRRADAYEHKVLWGDSIPFVFERRIQVGNDDKLSFRNVLTKKLEHLTVDRFGEVIEWSGYMGHGLTGELARTLELASRTMSPIETP